MTIDQWLDRAAARLAELIAVNGGAMEIRGTVGESRPSRSNRYGRVGLTAQEAFELTYMRGWFDALGAGCAESRMLAIRDRIGREIRGEVIEIPTPEMRERLLK